MRGLIHHMIKSPFGWGYKVKNLDISKIKNIYYHKRLFMIFQRNLPYTLTVEYEDPHIVYDIAHVFGKHVSVAMYSTDKSDKIITYRLSTEKECVDEINNIENKKLL